MRFIVLLLSLGTLVLYGRAIAGLWGYLLGIQRPGMIVTGLLGGTITAVSAVLLWRKGIRNLQWVTGDEEKDEE